MGDGISQFVASLSPEENWAPLLVIQNPDLRKQVQDLQTLAKIVQMKGSLTGRWGYWTEHNWTWHDSPKEWWMRIILKRQTKNWNSMTAVSVFGAFPCIFHHRSRLSKSIVPVLSEGAPWCTLVECPSRSRQANHSWHQERCSWPWCADHIGRCISYHIRGDLGMTSKKWNTAAGLIYDEILLYVISYYVIDVIIILL